MHSNADTQTTCKQIRISDSHRGSGEEIQNNEIVTGDEDSYFIKHEQNSLFPEDDFGAKTGVTKRSQLCKALGDSKEPQAESPRLQ